MATTILPFVTRNRMPAKRRAWSGEATIIIFPGVRYEAVTETGAKDRPKGGAGSTRKRKAKISQV